MRLKKLNMIANNKQTITSSGEESSDLMADLHQIISISEELAND